MTNNEFQAVGLYDHNAYSYRIVRNAYESGEDVVGIVHATGTGKSYNALQLAYDNKDKKIVYVVPSNGIIEHIKKIIEDNPNLDTKRDFPNLKFRTYQSFISLDKEEIANIDCDLLILDEFHHIGAPIWGARINIMIDTHPNMKIFGMTAYTVRDRGTSYERDMANPDTDELFSGKIESRYDLCDAMIDGVLPKPVYKSAYANLIGLESKLEERVQKLNATSREYQEYMAILSDVKRRIHEAPSIPNILRKSIKPNGKYIYFCPPCSEEGTNDIETIKKQAIKWFKEFIPEEGIVIYTSTSDMGEDGKINRDAFYDDVTLDGESADNKLRIMFAINQYNEGIHAPNIDGVIMGRGTTSDIVYFEQLGRALSVRGNTKEMFDELEKYSLEELIQMCESKDISVNETTTKEELIEKLIAPVVIDLTNNYDFIKELENNLKDRIKDIQSNGLGSHQDVKIKDASFDVEIENQDLFEMLRYVRDRLTMTWEDYYELAKAYYEQHNDLNMPQYFKTINGMDYDESGYNLGRWIGTQRTNYNNKKLDDRKEKLLSDIGIIWENNYDYQWNKMYELAKSYFENNKNLLIPKNFITKNGIIYDESGHALGRWIITQRTKNNKNQLDETKKQLLNDIGMVWNLRVVKANYWDEMYKLAKNYFENKGNLLIPRDFKTKNGVDYDESGYNLGQWINNQRQSNSTNQLDNKKVKLLDDIGMVWNAKQNFLGSNWNKIYELAKNYFKTYGNLSIPREFKTSNGIDYDENGISLGKWLSNQKQNNAKNILSPVKKQLLEQIGITWHGRENCNTWEESFELAKCYYEAKGNLLIPQNFKTSNGIDYDEHGFSLGGWINHQRARYFQGALDEIKVQSLNEIGMIWDIKKNKKEKKELCLLYGISEIKNKSILRHISMQELYSKIEFLKAHNIPLTDENGVLIDIFSISSCDMKDKYGISLEEMINEYYIKTQVRKGV